MVLKQQVLHANGGPGPSGMCDQAEIARTHKLLASESYAELTDSPCITAEKLESLQDGSEHPHDAWEFVGSVEATNCTDTHAPHEFHFPGACQQLPRSDCTKNQLPSLLYLGLHHAGSSSLAWQLNAHPELSYGKQKEHSFFTTPSDEWSTPYGGGVCCTGRNMLCDCRKKETYKREFPVSCRVKHTFDATPASLFLGDATQTCTSNKDTDKCATQYHWRFPGREALEDVKKMLGSELKLIMMFRDPVDIMASMYPNKKDTIEEHLDDGVGLCYADAVEGWMAVFEPENFLFIKSEDYFTDPQRILDRIFSFLEVSPKIYTEKDMVQYGRRRASNSVDVSDIRKKFHSDSRNQDCQKRLEAMTGLSFDWPERK